MTPNRVRVPDEKGDRSQPRTDAPMTWGSRKSESESVARADARPGRDDGLVHCPACGSEKTTIATSADRGPGSSIRADNTGYRCFACGTGWTMTISGDHDPDRHRES